MQPFHRSIIIFILLLAPCLNAHGAQFVGVGDKKPADLAEVVKNVERADVIFIGEIHYNEQHHKAQLDIVRSLHGKKIPMAIGLEMFTQEDQQKLDDGPRGSWTKKVSCRFTQGTGRTAGNCTGTCSFLHGTTIFR